MNVSLVFPLVLTLVFAVTGLSGDYLLPWLRNNAQDERCKQQIGSVIKAARSFELWGLQILDASGKLPSGLLRGNIRSLGDFEECVEATGVHDTVMVHGRYCLITMRLQPDPLFPYHERVARLIEGATVGRASLETFGNRSVRFPVPDLMPSLAQAQLGVCIPAACDPHEVQAALVVALKHSLKPLGVKAIIELSLGACYDKESTKMPSRTVEIVFLALVYFLLSVAVCATLLSMFTWCKNSSTCQDIVETFSLSSNWERLHGATTTSSIPCIDGLRVYSTLWLSVTHKLMLLWMRPLVNQSRIQNVAANAFNMPLSNGMIAVDSFFFISGLLRAQGIIRDLHNGKHCFVRDAVRRYCRLTPSFVFLTMFYVTVLPRLGAGPYGNSLTKLAGEACETNWPFTVLYLNNFLQGNSVCAHHTWYLTADMQYFLLAPLLVIPIWRRPRLAPTVMVISLMLATAIPFFYTLHSAGLPTFILNAKDTQNLHYWLHIHINPYMRLAPYLVGIGFAIFNANKPTYKLNKVANISGWMLCLIMLGAVIWGPYEMMQVNYVYEPLKVALLGAFHRPVWAFALAWIVFACQSNHGGFIGKILSARWLQPLGRLSYCFYLSHMAVLLIDVGRKRVADFMDELALIRECIADLVLTLVASLVLHLLVEAPAARLMTMVSQKKDESENNKKNL